MRVAANGSSYSFMKEPPRSWITDKEVSGLHRRVSLESGNRRGNGMSQKCGRGLFCRLYTGRIESAQEKARPAKRSKPFGGNVMAAMFGSQSLHVGVQALAAYLR